jgi:hypothetical protein
MEKIVFGFFLVMALTLNFGFFLGEIDNSNHHHVMELAAAIVVNLIATILKFGDRSQIGALLLSTSLVADFQLILAAGIWVVNVHVYDIQLNHDIGVMANIVSLSGGALLANIISIILLVIETVIMRR